ncbi:hypothetical protein HDU83_009459 [Entophlyctis luteolus]|nr:hypothetical protein HDU83_009459 [Entophlyctis luteolus]
MATPNSIPTQINYFQLSTYAEAADWIKQRLPAELSAVQVGIICGSGLGGLADALQSPLKEFHYKDIPNFAESTGHAGKLVFGKLGGKTVMCMVGRFHAYEGHSLLRTVFPVRVMKLLGVETLIVTNAAGGLNPAYNVGDVVFLQDHISLPGMAGLSPLIGPNLEEFGPRFPATADAYDFGLRVAAFRAAQRVPGLTADGASAVHEGVYCMVAGPSYETRAEARLLRGAFGADCVGMSTVPEVLAARHAGIRVLGISLITNHVNQSVGRSAAAVAASNGPAIPDPDVPPAGLVNHQEVLVASDKRSRDMQDLVKNIVELI